MLLDFPMSRAALQKGNSLLSAAATVGTGQAYWIGAYLITKSPYVWAWRGLDQSASVLMNCGGSATDPPTVKGCGPWNTAQVRHDMLLCSVCKCAMLAANTILAVFFVSPSYGSSPLQPDDAGGIQNCSVVNAVTAGGRWEDDAAASLHPYMCLVRWKCAANYYCTQGSKQVRACIMFCACSVCTHCHHICADPFAPFFACSPSLLQVKCPAGYGSAEGSQGACTICPAGKYGLGLGLGCDKCRMGMWSPGGNTACSPCDAGKYSGTGGGWGTSTCAGSCPAGQYSVGGAIMCSLVSVLSLHLSGVVEV